MNARRILEGEGDMPQRREVVFAAAIVEREALRIEDTTAVGGQPQTIVIESLLAQREAA